MKKAILFVILTAGLLFAGCSQPETIVPWSSSVDTSNPGNAAKFASLDFSDVTTIPEPDEIVFHHKGKETVYPKGEDKYEETLSHVHKIFAGKMERLLLAVDLPTELKLQDILEYRYEDADSIYFALYGEYENWIWYPTADAAYGNGQNAEELINFLK